MFSRRVAVSGVVFSLMLGAVLAADAINPIGVPKDIPQGGGDGTIQVWYADGSWHIRTSTENSKGKKDKLLTFSGTITSDGKVTAEGKQLEKKKGSKTADTLTSHSDGKGFDFSFKTSDKFDEATFKIAEGAKSVTFKLQFNGEEVQTSRVFIGEKSEHPAKGDFTFPANPRKP